jgi:cyclic pyranopterin phosphate synthase
MAGDLAAGMLPLVDRFGRVATDLRVSLTDRCNLRCSYCMPAEGLDWLQREGLLTDLEVGRLIKVAITRLGVNEVRFTGGEPLLRPGLVGLVASTAALGVPTSLTTNGIGLAEHASGLVAAGLSRVNVSLDTLRADRFDQIAHRKRLEDTLDGIDAISATGLRPVKINTVLLRGINDDEACELLDYCLERGYELRFIEQMPLDPMHRWDREQFVTAAEILVQLSTRWTLTADPGDRDHAPAERWLVDGGPGTVGIVGSVSRPFCATCNRTRLTADGQIRNCLFAQSETDLRGPLREGASDDDLAGLWLEAMAGKRPGHGIDDPGFLQPTRPMSAIGG